MQVSIPYAVLNSVFAISIVLGIFYNVGFALTIAEIIGWWSAIAGCLILIKPVKEGFIRTRRPLPNEFIDVTFDLIVIYIFYTNGYFFLPGFYLAHVLLLKSFRNEYKAYWKRMDMQNKPLDPKELGKNLNIDPKHFKPIGKKDKKNSDK